MKRIKNYLEVLTLNYGKEFYKLLYCVSQIYGVDIDIIIKDCGESGFSMFWELLQKYYTDMKGKENN